MIDNKKGNVSVIIFFFFALFLILFAGLLMVIGSAVLNWTFDEAVPEFTNLGSIGGTNMTEIASMTITPLNTFVQNLTWLVGVFYVLMLVGSFGIIFINKSSPSRWLMGFYFMLMILLVVSSMFVSNIYEEFYTGTDELSTRLQEHTIISWLILYSPFIFTLMGFLTGIVLFSGMQQEEFT